MSVHFLIHAIVERTVEETINMIQTEAFHLVGKRGALLTSATDGEIAARVVDAVCDDLACDANRMHDAVDEIMTLRVESRGEGDESPQYALEALAWLHANAGINGFPGYCTEHPILSKTGNYADEIAAATLADMVRESFLFAWGDNEMRGDVIEMVSSTVHYLRLHRPNPPRASLVGFCI